ncbi:HAMP domain-containing histidine kinase [Candidatus Daviesbacteria bacterium]|nr:HAMP domain-containing histidine kinase [Candidatus Daviesbacteria bacterium]
MFFPAGPKRTETLTALWKISKVILNTLDFNHVVQNVVDSLLFELNYLKRGYRIIVLTLIDEKSWTLRRISLSQTEEAQKAQAASAVPFHQIEIPLTAVDNLLIKVINERKAGVTSYWPDLFKPVLTVEQALANQSAAGVKTSLIYPVITREKVVGALIFSLIKDIKDVTEEEQDLLGGFTDLVGLAVQNSSLYSSLQATTIQLKEANERLKVMDKLKDDFVSIASHELRTPMTAIRSYAWMALHRSGTPLSQTLEKYITRILISTERLINLVNDMLNVSRIESGKVEINPESVDLKLLVKDIVDEVYFSKSEEKRVEFVVAEKPVPKAFADPEKLRQVFLNLVGNSLKFTPAGGRITFDFFSDGHTVDISVIDTGVGISKDDAGKLFNKFSRLDSSYTAAATSGGTGLGLYISKNLVELMHGQIKVYSEGLGKGATFTVTLPVASAEILEKADQYRVKAQGEAKGLEPVAI